MMFFLARSAVCIGLVAAAASTANGGAFGAAVDGAARDAVSTALGACSAAPRCLAGAAEALAAEAAPPPAPAERADPPSRRRTAAAGIRGDGNRTPRTANAGTGGGGAETRYGEHLSLVPHDAKR